MTAEPAPGEWAMSASPLPGPGDFVPPGKPGGVVAKRRAVSPPLLQFSLPVGHGCPSTPDAGSTLRVPDQQMLAFPEVIGPLSSGHCFGPYRSAPGAKPNDLLSGRPGGPHLGVHFNEVLLPLSNLVRPVLVKSPRPRALTHVTCDSLALAPQMMFHRS